MMLAHQNFPQLSLSGQLHIKQKTFPEILRLNNFFCGFEFFVFSYSAHMYGIDNNIDPSH